MRLLGLALVTTVALSALDAAGATVAALNNENGLAVSNGPTGGNPQLTLATAAKLEVVRTYHWNNAKGAAPGQLWLEGGPNKQKYGPWPATVLSKFYWQATPTNVYLPAGTYTVFDSEPTTWSYNAQSGNKGFTLVNVSPQSIPTLGIDDAKGVVSLFRPVDRAPVTDQLSLDAKGPVKAFFGMIPSPSLAVDKPTPAVGEVVTVKVNAPFEGYSYYFEVAPGLAYGNPGSGPLFFQLKPSAKGTYTVIAKTKASSVKSAPPYEFARISITSH